MNELSKNRPQSFQDPIENYDPSVYSSDLQRALAEETIEAITSRPYHRIEASETVRQALQRMSDEKTASLLVTEDDELVGIFTERDVLEKVVERYLRVRDRPIREVMTEDPTVVYETDPAAAAVAAIAIAGHRHVPVLDLNERLTGMISPRRVFDFVDAHSD